MDGAAGREADRAERDHLRALARLYRVQTSFRDTEGTRRRASRPALYGVLRALGAPLDGPRDLPAAIVHRQRELGQRMIEPVVVAWDGRIGLDHRLRLRLPVRLADRAIDLLIRSEDGAPVRSWRAGRVGRIVPAPGVGSTDGVDRVDLDVVMPGPGLPLGYLRLEVEVGGRRSEALVIAAPRRTTPGEERSWGVYVPLYALWSERSWGPGDLTDLGRLAEWVGGLGGGIVSTLPLTPTFLDEPFDPSPYAPISRLFWSELYVDVERSPELERSREARALLAHPSFHHAVDAHRREGLVDYRGAMALKRRALEALARTFFASSPAPRRAAFQQFAGARPELETYAAFRAEGDRRRTAWTNWPQPQRDGVLADRPDDRPVRQYHAYVQWLAHEQMQAEAERARRAGVRLGFDLPLGVNRAGYDTWREREAFALDCSTGAPPDMFFPWGQDWAIPPLHPERIRDQGYRYPIASLRHLLRHGGALRVDHVLGLHRLYWIPEGVPAEEGVYVRYAAEEMYAILALESRRTGTVIIGENLGIVGPDAAYAVARHGLQGMYVVQLELERRARGTLPAPAGTDVASVNTHDLPTFRAFWNARDVDGALAVHLIDGPMARRRRAARGAARRRLVDHLRSGGWLRPAGRRPDAPPTDRTVLRATWDWLAAGQAQTVLLNLEDLWMEVLPQNVPGTGPELPNWRRRSARSMERFQGQRTVLGTLRRVDDLRKRGAGG